MRSRAPPVADAARRSTRSGRKNRASEQREDFFGHRKAVGADTPWLPLERICAQYGFRFFFPEKSKPVSSTAKRQRGLSRGNSSPLTVFWFLLYAQKERPGGEPYRPSPCGDSAPPLGDHKLAPPGRHTDYAFVKGPATPKATTNLAPAG